MTVVIYPTSLKVEKRNNFSLFLYKWNVTKTKYLKRYFRSPSNKKKRITGQNLESDLSKIVFPISPSVEAANSEKSKFVFSKDKTTNLKAQNAEK